jgi:hypothetical protein
MGHAAVGALPSPLFAQDDTVPRRVYFSPSTIKVVYLPVDGDSEQQQQQEKAEQLIRDHCDGPYESKVYMRHGRVFIKAQCI